MYQGRSSAALAAARQVAQAIPAKSRDNTWAMYELFRSQPYFVMVRFGKWSDVLDEPKPEVGAQFITGIWHYARGLAYTHRGQTDLAQKEHMQLQKLHLEAEEDEMYYAGFGAAGGLLTIADEILTGEIIAKNGDIKKGISHLDRAVRLEDGLL